MTVEAQVRAFISENFLFGSDAQLSNTDSLLEAGVIDSTGAMELVTFLEKEFGIRVDDHDLVPDNLDCVEAIASFVSRKLAQTDTKRSLSA